MVGLAANMQPVRQAVNDRGLFTAGWFGVREKYCSQLEIYDRLRANEQTVRGEYGTNNRIFVSRHVFIKFVVQLLHVE